MLTISGVRGEVAGQRGQGLGEAEKQPPDPALHGGLAAEDDLQVLAVELPRLSQGHDTLSVVGELLDIHFLGDTRREKEPLTGWLQWSVLSAHSQTHPPEGSSSPIPANVGFGVPKPCFVKARLPCFGESSQPLSLSSAASSVKWVHYQRLPH